MSARNFYIMQSAVAPMQSELPCYTPLTNHRTELHTVPMVMAADYAALEAENAALKHRCGMFGLELENAEERRIQAERQVAILRQHKTDYMEAAEETRLALEAERERLRNSMLHLVTTHCAEAMKNNAATTDLDQYLSAGIAQLEAGILELRAQLAAIKGQEVDGGN